MHFLENMDAVAADDAEAVTYECEVSCYSQMVGQFEYGPYSLMLWEFSDKPDGQERKLCLRVKSVKHRGLSKRRKNAYYHGGWIPDELIALSCLFLRRKLKLGRVVRMNDKPHMGGNAPAPIDPQLLAGKSRLSDLRCWFEHMERLSPRYHLKFMLAVRLYHRAVMEMEDNPDFAYLNLVSAIEALCGDTKIDEVPLCKLSATLGKLVDSIEPESLRLKVGEAILKREKHISRRFVQFILDHVEASFWQESTVPSQAYRIKREDLPEYVKRVYNQRSKLLHEGKPFPPMVFMPNVDNSEIDNISAGMGVGKKEWTPKEYIPYPSFFERLVNHVLRSYLKRHLGGKPRKR